jgi:hypothetical protein
MVPVGNLNLLWNYDAMHIKHVLYMGSGSVKGYY